MPLETMDFVLDNLREIKQAQSLKQKVIEALQKELLQQLQSHFSEKKVSTKLHHWHGYPAIRFYFEDWDTKSVAVLFLDGRKGESFCINYYAAGIINPKQRDEADRLLKEEDCSKQWDKETNQLRGYKAPIDNFDKTIALERLIHKLSLLDRFETEVRSQW